MEPSIVKSKGYDDDDDVDDDDNNDDHEGEDIIYGRYILRQFFNYENRWPPINKTKMNKIIFNQWETAVIMYQNNHGKKN